MSEWLRTTLEVLVAPEPLYTDLSDNRSPAFSLAQQGQKVLARDIAGGVRLLDSYTLVLRHCAIQEGDRRRAYARLVEITERLHRVAVNDGDVVAVSTALPMFHEVYDDGMATWSMAINIESERK